MRQIALSVLGGLLASVLAASPSGAFTYTYKLANPSQVVAYQIGSGVITIATAVVVCQPTELVLDKKPFVYDFKIGTAIGVLCGLGPHTATIAAYYQAGSPSTVTVNTKAGAVTVTVQPAPPVSPTTSHLPFH